MPKTCPKCSRANPPQALYCYHDGSALGHHVANVDQGTQPFPFPFVFPSGRSCRNFDQLALACLDEWSSVLDLLRQGDLANFLAGLGRADLALAARQAARFPDPDRGLDQLLAQLPTRALEPARLRVEPAQVNLGVLRPGQDSRFTLHLVNQGMRLLHGTVTCEDCVWLALGDAPGAPQKLFDTRSEVVIAVHVRGKLLRAGNKPLQGEIVVDSNGGVASVLVRAEVPVQPFPEGVLAGALSPRQVAEKAKANPKLAGPLFENGAVARWYQDNGWTYPVQGPAGSGLGAVQQFFEALGLVTPPRVEVREEAIHLQGKVGEQLTYTLEVAAQEKRPVYAHAVSNQPWLEVGRVQMGGQVAAVRLTVPSVPDRPGETLTARLTITANGNQRFVLPVTLAIAGQARTFKMGRALNVVEDVQEVVEPGASSRRRPPVRASRVVPVQAVAVEPIPEVLPVTLPGPAGDGYSSARRDAGPTPLPSGPGVPPGARRQKPLTAVLVHLIPVAFLVMGLLATVARDLLRLAAAGKGSQPNVAAGSGEAVIAVHFHDEEVPVNISQEGGGIKLGGGPGLHVLHGIWEPSMRFGLVMLTESQRRVFDPDRGRKRLTYDDHGLTNNTCVRLDGNEWLFGERPWRDEETGEPIYPDSRRRDWPGRWKDRDRPLGPDAQGRPRQGRASVWVYDQEQVQITQTVELVEGELSGNVDTCLVRYRIENQDAQPHRVGLRFMLDTFIGSNDGVPFLIPGERQLCDTARDLRGTGSIPQYIQALEREDLADPGTVAQVRLRLGGAIEPPDRVTLGAWPNPELGQIKHDPRCRQEKTLWEVPIYPIKTIPPGDSCVVLYWGEQDVAPGAAREVGFAYGLGNVSGGEGQGRLALTVGGEFIPGGEITLTAYVRNPTPDQTVTVTPPNGFDLVQGSATQPVPPLARGSSSRTSPVTWHLKAPGQAGDYVLRVQSSTGETQTQRVSIRLRTIFGD